MANNLDPKQLEEYEKKLKDIERLSKKFGENIDVSKFKDIEKSVDEIDRLYDSLIAQSRKFEKSIEGTLQDFEKMVKELKNLDSAQSQVVISTTKLEDLASKLVSHKTRSNTLQSTELANIQNLAKQELKRATDAFNRLSAENQSAKEKLEAELESLKNGKHYNKLKGEERTAYRQIKKDLELIGKEKEELEKQQDRLNKKAQEFIDITQEELDKIPKVVKGFDALETAISKAGAAGRFLTNITTPAILGKLFLDLDTGAGKLAKSFNISYNEALALKKELAETATITGDANLSSRAQAETLMSVGEALGSNAKLNEKDLQTYTKLREQAGLQAETLNSILKVSLATGKTVESYTDEFLDQTKLAAQRKGIVINEKQALVETAKVSASIKLSLGGSAESLAKAQVAAKLLGSDLDKVNNIAEQLLDFESSIEAELEAELLTGKNINLERARLAAINGDLATVAEEITKEIGSSAEFSAMNRLQQEAIAKAVGMTRDDLAASLVEREALKNLSGKEAEAAKAAFNARVEEVGLTRAQEELKSGGIEKLMEQQSIQEKFNAAVETAKELFIEIAAGPMQTIANIMTFFVEHAGLLKGIFAVIAGIMTTRMVAGLMRQIQLVGGLIPLMGTMLGISTAKATADVTSAEALTVGGATVAILAGLAAVGAAMYAAFSEGDAKASEMSAKKVGDASISPVNKGGGLIVATPDFGKLYQGDKRDGALLGPPGALANQPKSNTPTVSQEVMLAEQRRTNSLQETTNQYLRQIAQKPAPSLFIDGAQMQ